MKNAFLWVGSEGQRPDHPLARLHPAAQLLGAALLLVGVVSVPSAHQFPRLLPSAGLLFLGLFLVPFRLGEFLRGLSYLAVFFALVFLWPLLSYGNRWQGFLDGALSSSKIFLLYITGFLLVRCTSRWDVAGVLERVLQPFARVSRLSLMLALTLSLLPVLETTATSLCASFAGRVPRRWSGKWIWIKKLPLLLSAYVVRSLDRGERLSRALVARHFCGRLGPRQARRQRPFRWADLVFLLLVILGLGLSVRI